MIRKIARFALVVGAALAIGAATLARAEEATKASVGEAPSPAAAQFDRLKALAGTWVGTAGHGEEKFPTEVSYRVTAGGNTIIETLFAGTEHEMITMYHMDGGELVLTHYCVMGNQPKMRLVASEDPNTLAFDFAGGSNITPAGQHMHSAKITLVDADHLRSTWTSHADGKPVFDAEFELARKK